MTVRLWPWEDLDLHLGIENRVDPLSAPLPPEAALTPTQDAQLTYEPEAHDIRIESIESGLCGLRWELSDPIDAGRVRLTFTWESWDETGLGADQIAVSIRDANDTQLVYETFDRRGDGYNSRETLVVTGETTVDVALVYVYARSNVTAGMIWAINGLMIDDGYVQVLGDTNTIKVSRATLDAGTLSATILDSKLDPTQPGGQALTPGSGVELSAVDPSTGTREAIFTGTLQRAKITWDVKGHDTSDPLFWEDHPTATRVDIEAADLLGPLGQISDARGVATVDDLRYLMAQHPAVPFNINGSTDTKASGTVTVESPSATLLDQVIIARDSDAPGSMAWIGRDGRLWANDNTVGHTIGTAELITDPNLQDPNQWAGIDQISQTIDGRTCSRIYVSGSQAEVTTNHLQIEADRDLSWDIDVYVAQACDVQAWVKLYDADGTLLATYPDDPAVPVPADTWYSLGYGTGGLPIEGNDDLPVATVVAGITADTADDVYASRASLTQDRRLLGEDKVSQIGTDWDSDTIVNEVMVTVQAGLGDQARSVTVGPYRDTDSIAKWGTRRTDVTVHDAIGPVDIDDPATYQAIGERVASGLFQPDPELRVHTATVPINDATRFGEVFAELEDRRFIRVGHARAGGSIDTIEHDITPDGWLVHYGFRTEHGKPPTIETTTLKPGNVTDWQPLVIASGYAWRSGYEGKARQIGGMIIIRGQIDMNTGPWTSYDTVASLPNGWTFPYQVNIYQQDNPGDWMIYARADSGALVTKGGPPNTHANIATVLAAT